MIEVRALTVERIKEIRDRTARSRITRTSIEEEVELCDLALAYLEEHPELVRDEGQGDPHGGGERRHALPSIRARLSSAFWGKRDRGAGGSQKAPLTASDG